MKSVQGECTYKGQLDALEAFFAQPYRHVKFGKGYKTCKLEHDENLALEIALWLLGLFNLDMKMNLPQPTTYDDYPDIDDLKVPPGFDAIFDAHWETANDMVDLGLSKFQSNT